MNTNSVTKFFTAVSFLLVTVFGNPGFAATNREDCVSETLAKYNEAGECPTQGYQDCNTKRSNDADKACKHLPTKADAKEGDAACKEAHTAYNEDSADSQNACQSLVGSSSRSDSKKLCSEKIAECEKMAQSTSSQTAQDDGGISSTLNIFRQVMSSEPAAGLSGNGCLVDFDSKDAREAEKEFRDRKKELEKEKKEIEDEAIKDKEDYDKEETRITKEKNDLEKDLEKTKNQIDSDKRQKQYDAQKATMDSAQELLKISKQMRDTNDKLRQATFTYSQQMLSLSAEKQNLRCKSALDAAKNCMIKSVKGIQDAACKDFPIVIRSKGPKATAELKAQLQQVSDACYEKEKSDKSNAEFAQQEKMNQLSNALKDLQDQAQHIQETQSAAATNDQKIQSEADTQKTAEQQAADKHAATLQNEVVQFAQKLQAKQARAQERLAKLAQDLQALELEQKTGKRSTTRLAAAAVRKTNAKLEDVKAQCDCGDDFSAKNASTANKKVCASVKRGIPAGSSSSKTRTTSKPGSSY